MKTTAKVSAIVAALASALATACMGADVTDQIQYFANPAKYYFPKENITNAAARCCTRIKAIGGRLYIGMGDYTYNTGPTPVVALSPQTGTFTNEYSAGTEAIDDFKVFSNGKVYVPSLDPRENHAREGHFFIRSSVYSNGTWARNKTIPKGVVNSSNSSACIYTHCWDLAEFDGKIHFAGYGTASATLSGGTIGTFSDTCPTFDINEWDTILQWFENKGKWQYCGRSRTDLRRIYSFLEVDGVLYAVPNNKFAPGHDGTPVTSWDDVTYNTSDTYLFRYSPETGLFSPETNAWTRIIPSTGLNDALFLDMSSNGYATPVSTPMIVERTLKTSTGKSYYIATMRYRPLGVYRATISSADGKLSSQKISLGANTWPMDIIEADGKVRILAFSFDGSSTNIVNKVFESSDGETFSESFRFNHRQIASAFEYLDGSYFFGFGTCWKTLTHEAAANYVMSTDHNGEIWKYTTSSQPDDPPGPGPDDPPDPPDPGVEADHWTYDSAAGTISDGIWKFNAAVSGTDMSVTLCTQSPSTPSTLDLSKPVKGAGDVSYTIVTLGQTATSQTAYSLFGKTTDYWKNFSTEIGTTLAEVILPQSGLKKICNGSFGGCTALTNIVNFIPDSVTVIEQSAFALVPAHCDLYVTNVSSFGRCVFYGSGITSVHFGRKLTYVGNNIKSQGAFESCKSLTNIVFHSEGSGITIDGEAFKSSSTGAKIPLALYGVKSISSEAFSGWKIPSVTFDNGIESFGSLAKVTTLTNVCFLGAPPASQTGTWADYNQGTATVTTYVPYAFRQQWWQYAAGYDAEMSSGQKEMLIKIEGTTFSSEYATDPDKRPLLLSSLPSVTVPQPVFSGAGASAPRLDAQGRFVMSIGNAVAGGRYQIYATTSLSEPFQPVGDIVTASADGALEFAVDTNSSPSLFVKIVAE